MARQKTGDKAGDIRKAAIAEVVEVGSAAASVNAIARRAGLAVGTLYRYHESKERLLADAYLSVKADIHAALMGAAEGAHGSAAKLRAMWFALLRFAAEAPQAFAFVEVVLNASVLDDDDRAEVAQMAREAEGVIVAAITDGTLRPGEPGDIATVLTAPATQLGRRAALEGGRPDPAQAERVFALCWRAVTA